MAATELELINVVDDPDYSERLSKDAKKREHGTYPRTIFIGLGGTGAKALLHLRRLTLERFGKVDALEGVAYISIDTDVRSQDVSAEEEKRNPLAKALAFRREERVNVKLDFKSYVGPNIIYHPQIREWWDEKALPSQDFDLEKGAGQIRPLSRLAFFTNREAIREALNRAYRKVSSHKLVGSRVESDAAVRVVVVAGLAGGTGSGMLLDLAALVQVELQHQETPSTEGFFVLPGGFSSVEKSQNYNKLAANGLAALRELNHYLTHPLRVQWESNAEVQTLRGLYGRYVLFSGTNASGEKLDDIGECYRAVGEILFLDFGAGPMAGWVQGVRVNREQYLRSALAYPYLILQADGERLKTHSDQWKNAFSSVGISKLVFPSWRLINKAKYQLAAEMVALMDPGRFGKLEDVITYHRSQFLFDCGFFQGERKDEEGRHKYHWQIRDRLARQSGVGDEVSSVYNHIARYREELTSLAESMYTDKNTREEASDVWRQLTRLWGDPESRGNEGDWAQQIVKNRRALVREVESELPRVIEEFRRKPAVGISGVLNLLRSSLDLLDKPADQARYSDWFRQRRPRLREEMDEARKLWDKRLGIAGEAERGILSKPDNHGKAVERLGQALEDFWRAQVNDLICLEGEKAAVELRTVLKRQLERLERIAEKMQTLEAQYRRLSEFYGQPQISFLIRELDVPVDDDLLTPYVGEREVREERLQRLLDRGLREMGLTTLAEIGSKLDSELDDFRDNLSAQAFFALRGQHGETAMFSEQGEPPKEGFIERYSILRMLKDNFESKEGRNELYELLYRKGLPWAQKNQINTLAEKPKPYGDAFIGVVGDNNEGLAQELVQFLQSHAEDRFHPRRVRAHDPSEIIFYTELTAFPAYYLSEVPSLQKDYDHLMNDTKRRTPLHIHQDYHLFQPLAPLTQDQVAALQRAWRLFIEGEMVGLIRSRRLRVGDDSRLLFQWRKKVSRFEVRWTDLGPQGDVIRRLMTDPSTANQLQEGIKGEIEDHLLGLDKEGWCYLLSLADYYYYCLFPVRSNLKTDGSYTESLGSIQNLVCSNLRQDFRSRAVEALPEEEVDRRIQDLLARLAEWTLPVFREPTEAVPVESRVPTGERLEEWELLGSVDESLRSFYRQGILSESLDAQGRAARGFPHLRLKWAYFEEQSGKNPVTASAGEPREKGEPTGSDDEPPPLSEPQPVDAEKQFHYAVDGTRCGKLSAAEIVQKLREAPEASHRVWAKGFGSTWKPISEVAEIVDLIDDEPPPLD